LHVVGLAALLSAAVTACAARVPERPGCDSEAPRARLVAARIERQWPLRGADEVTDLVRIVGSGLGRQGTASSRTWGFVVLRSRAANAFAIGDGRIYLTDGALDACATEAELAAMIAHEMGHQLAGHFCRGVSDSARSTRIGSLVQHIDPAQEREADRLAVEILIAAGYDARAALTVAQRIDKDPAADGRRVEALRRLVEAAPATGRSDSEEFRRVKRLK
jgi:predicted Zn-dependent protease